MKNLISIIAIVSLIALSCSKDGDSVNNFDPYAGLSMKVSIESNESNKTKSLTANPIDHIQLYYPDGTPSGFQLEVYDEPTDMHCKQSSTKAKLYGSGENHYGGATYNDYLNFEGPIRFTAWQGSNNIYTNARALCSNKTLKLWAPEKENESQPQEGTDIEINAILPDINGSSLWVYDNTLKELDFAYSEPENSMEQEDLMFGYFKGKPKKENNNNVADVKFTHALASLRFVFVNDFDTDITVNEISIHNVYGRADCYPYLESNKYSYNWEPDEETPLTSITSGNIDFTVSSGYSYDVAVGVTDEIAGNPYIFTVIPQDLTVSPAVLELKMTNDGTTTVLHADINTGIWLPGHTNVYRLAPIQKPSGIDLGLSVIWASKALNASKWYEAGSCFRWAETVSYGNDDNPDADYKYADESGMTRYYDGDGWTVLIPEDDAATTILGENWRTPTENEVNELLVYSDKYYTTWGTYNMHARLQSTLSDGYILVYFVHGQGTNSMMTASLDMNSNSMKYIYYRMKSYYDCEERELPLPSGGNFKYTYTAVWEKQTAYRMTKDEWRNEHTAEQVYPVKSVVIFDAPEYKNKTTIEVSGGTTVSFTLAPEYTAQTWTASNGDSGTGSGSITVSSGQTITISRNTGIVCATIIGE